MRDDVEGIHHRAASKMNIESVLELLKVGVVLEAAVGKEVDALVGRGWGLVWCSVDEESFSPYDLIKGVCDGVVDDTEKGNSRSRHECG